MICRLISGAAALSVALSLAAVARGAELIRAELTAAATQPRMEAPMWVEIKLTSTTPQLREGSLEFTHRVLGAPQWTYTTQEIALAGGTQTYRFLLPPAQTRETDDRSLRVRFLEATGASDLGLFPITTQARPGWPLTLAIGSASARGAGEMRPPWLNFRLERFAAGENTPAAASPLVSTSAAVLEPADFPADPLGYTAFDAVLLEGSDFARLKEKSLTALGQWVLAGGGLLVTADAAFDAVHAKALETWMQSDPKGVPARFDPAGSMLDVEKGMWHARAGFGQIVVMPRRAAAEKEYDLEPWRRATALLWQLRSDHVESVVRSGQLAQVAERYQYQYEFDQRLSQAVENLTRELLPRSVRVMPRGVVIGLLAGFVFVIGPLDWWLLGRLRARRFTWVLFPIVTAGFTVATMKLARHYLGEGQHRGGIVITDIAPTGEVVRETRLEVLLPDKRGTLLTEVQRAICVPVKLPVRDSSPVLTFTGQFPAKFTFRRPLQQWSPVITRQTRVGTGEDVSRMNWEAFTPGLLEKERPWDVAGRLAGNSGCAVAFAYRPGLGAISSDFIDANFIESITFPPQIGRLGIFSHFSPSGASSLSDLACIERGDASSSLVMAARREGSDLHLWRRLYYH